MSCLEEYNVNKIVVYISFSGQNRA